LTLNCGALQQGQVVMNGGLDWLLTDSTSVNIVCF